MIDFIGCLKAFTERAMIDQLNPSERAVYLAVFMLDNKVGWKEWVSITNFQLLLATGIKDVHTITKSRNKLKQLGYIDIDNGKRGVSPKYKIIPLGGGSIGENHNTIHNTYNNTPHNTYNNTPHNTDNNTPHNTDNNTIHNYTKTKTKTKTINNNITRAGAGEVSSDFSEVVKVYSENITTDISPVNAEKLENDVRTFGKDRVIKAIIRAGKDNKRSLGWVEWLLNNGREGDVSNARVSESAGGGYNEIIKDQQAPWDS